jgi:hypothetical protein
MVRAVDAASGFARRLHRWEQQGNEQTNVRVHYEHLDEREGARRAEPASLSRVCCHARI